MLCHSEALGFTGVRGHVPGKKIEIWGPRTAGNTSKLPVVPPQRYFISCTFFAPWGVRVSLRNPPPPPHLSCIRAWKKLRQQLPNGSLQLVSSLFCTGQLRRFYSLVPRRFGAIASSNLVPSAQMPSFGLLRDTNLKKWYFWYELAESEDWVRLREGLWVLGRCINSITREMWFTLARFGFNLVFFRFVCASSILRYRPRHPELAASQVVITTM